MAIGVAVYLAYGKRHSLVGSRQNDGLGLTQEELSATWRAEEDRGWVGRLRADDGASRPAGQDESARTFEHRPGDRSS
jgi:hypothetical protein